MLSVLRTIWMVFLHSFRKRDTVLYPEEKPYLPPRYRGRIVLTRDPDGAERCVACNLCAVACPVDCIALTKTEDETGRWYPETFQINFSRCIYCGFCEEARSEEHTSELQSRFDLVCRLLLEKKKTKQIPKQKRSR